MLRGGPAQDKQQEKQQKQKKRLSFRNPEVEGPQRTPLYASGRSKSLVKASEPRRSSFTEEDQTLEDQAFHIAHSVGNAFSNLSSKLEYLSPQISNSRAQVVTQLEKPEDCSPSDYTLHQRGCQLRSFKISTEDQEYLDSLTPPLLDLRMRAPPAESTELNSPKNCIPSHEAMEERYPRSAQHQIQLLKYQLDQQSQQTQMALHQVQLLTDQMEAESTARKKAQEQNNQLMKQNKELLDHIENLFQQIEDLEKQVHTLERENRNSKLPQEPQVLQLRPGASYIGNRKLNSDKLVAEKPVQNRNQFSSSRKSSLTSTKSLLPQSKVTPNPETTNKKNTSSVISQRPYTMQNKTDSSSKAKETLHIGDASPPVQSGSLSPFGSGWKLKTEANNPTTIDKTVGGAIRNRTGSFSSFGKIKPTEGVNTKTTLFSSSNSLSNSTSITNKRYSSSTSDLYSNTNTYQAKPLMIEEPSASAKTSISSLTVNAPSKLPRFQAYTGWQRRSSLSNDTDNIAIIGKETFKNAAETSLFNG